MNRITKLRHEKGITMAQAARELGIPYTTYVSYEKEDREPNSEMLIKLANYFKASIDYIIGRSDDRTQMDTANDRNYTSIVGIMPIPKMKKVPRLGTIACGEPILTEENFDGYDDIPEDIDCDFTLKCQGDSMINARINDGDIVYIKHQSIVDNGQIAAVMVNGETTLKRVFIYENQVILQAENPKYEPWIYTNEQINNIRIIGKAVYFLSKVR